MADDDRQYCLRWNNHQTTLISVFDTLFQNENLVDCTLAAEGRIMKAHKVVLSACSPYFATLLQEQYDKHPIFILKDVKFQELRAMMDYMYRGEVNISQDQLAALLKAAESLQIKGLSDNRTGGGSGGGGGSSNARAEQQQQPQQQHHHRGLNVPGSSKIGGGYTIETQSKRARVGAGVVGPMDTQDMSASREGSSSPSRRRRKVRRRSIENAMGEPHDNSNSSQQQQQQQQQPQSSLLQSNVNLAAAAVASALASQLPTNAGGNNISAAATQLAAQQQLQQQQQNQQMTSTTSSSSSGGGGGVTKKTENVKGTSDAMNTENVQVSATTSDSNVEGMEAQQQSTSHAKIEKQNHKQKIGVVGGLNRDDNAAEPVIEPKSEYDDDGNDETCEDLTLDDMGMDDLDQNAGTSQGGEGSSQGYAWPHERSQDELLLSTQEAQQRDPQDLTRRIIQLHTENKIPNAHQIQKTNQRSILNTTTARRPAQIARRSATPNQTNGTTINAVGAATGTGTGAGATSTPKTAVVVDAQAEFHKKLSLVDVSGMLSELYKTNAAKAPKTQAQQLQLKYRQTSPTSAEMNSSQIAAIALNGAAEQGKASKNLQRGEMSMPNAVAANENSSSSSNTKSMAFHPRIKYMTKQMTKQTEQELAENGTETVIMTSIPTSVVVPTSPQIDVKPIINPTTGMVVESNSVIKPVPTATAIAAAILQQQIRAASLSSNIKNDENASSKILEKLLRQQRSVAAMEHDTQRQSTAGGGGDINEDYDDDDDVDDDDEYDERYNDFDDIHLTEDAKNAAANSYNLTNSMPNIFQSSLESGAARHSTSDFNDTQKMLLARAQAHAMRNLEYTLSDYGNGGGNGEGQGRLSSPHNGSDGSGEPVYECRHCGKKYRWKSTLRRHENVECGGKEPSHQCPYCPYKSKQRGNLGVHVRKHHSDLPQLESRRRSKYSQNMEGAGSGRASSGSFSANASDDSSSKLVIDLQCFNK